MTIADKLTEIYTDLSHNVTFIYDRPSLIFAFDLAFHSALSFNFQGKPVHKGWVEALIVSDTRCGKSETADKLVNHYKLGEICSAENTSFAGLVGGMQQVGSRWHLTWGKIPINDRRLVIIDEVSGLETDVIGLMSGIRASGVAEIIKIKNPGDLLNVFVTPTLHFLIDLSKCVVTKWFWAIMAYAVIIGVLTELLGLWLLACPKPVLSIIPLIIVFPLTLLWQKADIYCGISLTILSWGSAHIGWTVLINWFKLHVPVLWWTKKVFSPGVAGKIAKFGEARIKLTAD